MMIAGITTIGTHAPLVNFVPATMISTTSVATAPMPLITACRFQPWSCSFWWCLTMPHCESVNDVNTPTAYSGISAFVSPPNAMSRMAAAPASRTMPFENTSRSPRFAICRGR